MKAHVSVALAVLAGCGTPLRPGAPAADQNGPAVDIESPVALTFAPEPQRDSQLEPLDVRSGTAAGPEHSLTVVQSESGNALPISFGLPQAAVTDVDALTSTFAGYWMAAAVVANGSQAGSYVLVGTRDPQPGTGRDIIVEKYNAAGVMQWQRVINGAANGDDYGAAVAVESAGAAIYVGGGIWDSDENERDAFLRKYDSNGNVQWTRTVDGTYNDSDIINGIALDESGNGVVVAGVLRNRPHYPAYNDAYGARYTSSGALVWSFTHNGAGNQHDAFNSVAVDGNGNAGFGGFTSLTADPSYARYTAYARLMSRTGALVWEGTFPRSNGGTSTIREVSYNNGIWAAAVSNNDPGENGGAIARYTTAGQVLSWWEVSDVTPRSVAVSSSGSLYVAGDSVPGGTFRLGRVVNGAWAWQATNQPTGYGYGVAVTGNRLVAAGFSAANGAISPYWLVFSSLP